MFFILFFRGWSRWEWATACIRQICLIEMDEAITFVWAFDIVVAWMDDRYA